MTQTAFDLDAVYTAGHKAYIAKNPQRPSAIPTQAETAAAAHLAGLRAVQAEAAHRALEQFTGTSPKPVPTDYEAQFASMSEMAEHAVAGAECILSLGGLIRALADSPGSNIVKVATRGRLFNPGDVGSYRGYYSELYIDYTEASERTVKSLLKNLRKAMGKTFTGYKGGEFTMGSGTSIFVDQYSMCDGIAACAVISRDGLTVILTDQVES
jgi:hypothetical protein